MGTWGTNVTEDDLSSDVIHDFMDAFNEGKHPEGIRKALEHAYQPVKKVAICHK